MNARKTQQRYNTIRRSNIRDLPSTFDVPKAIKILHIGASNMIFMDTDGNEYKINIPVREGWNDLQINDVVTVIRTLSQGIGQNKGIAYGVLTILEVEPEVKDTPSTVATTNIVESENSKMLKHLQELIKKANAIDSAKKQIIADLAPELNIDKEVITNSLVNTIALYVEEEYEEMKTLNLSKEEEIFFNEYLSKKIAKKLTDLLLPTDEQL